MVAKYVFISYNSAFLMFIVILQFWYKRLASLEAVRNQLNTAVVLNVLRSLDRVQSTYAHAFVHVHRYIATYSF